MLLAEVNVLEWNYQVALKTTFYYQAIIISIWDIFNAPYGIYLYKKFYYTLHSHNFRR